MTAEKILSLYNISDKYSIELAKLARDDDLFLNKYKYTIIWRRILRWFDWKTRYRALNSFVKGRIMPRWALKLYKEIKPLYEEHLKETIKSYKLVSVKNIKIAIVKADPRIHSGEIQYLLEKNGVNADYYIVVYPKALSLRSRKSNVALIAEEFGGGGHYMAAGIPCTSETQDIIINKIIKYFEKQEKNINTL